MDWWLTAQTPAGLACWQLGDVDDDQRDQLIVRARTLADVPVTDGVHLHAGRPHDKLLARCALRDRAELEQVDPAALAAYRGRMDQETVRARRVAARAALAALSPDDRAAVIAEHAPGGSPTPGRT